MGSVTQRERERERERERVIDVSRLECSRASGISCARLYIMYVFKINLVTF